MSKPRWLVREDLDITMPPHPMHLIGRDDTFRAMKLDVLTVDGDRIAATTTFGPELFSAFGLAATLEP